MYRTFFAGLVSIMITGQALASADDSGWVDDGIAYNEKAKSYDLGSWQLGGTVPINVPHKKASSEFGHTSYEVYDVDYFDDAVNLSPSSKAGATRPANYVVSESKWTFVTDFIPDEPVSDSGFGDDGVALAKRPSAKTGRKYADVGGYVELGGLDEYAYNDGKVEKSKKKSRDYRTYSLDSGTFWVDADPVYQKSGKAGFVEDFYPQASGKTKSNGTADLTDLYYTKDTVYGYGSLAPESQKKSDGSYDFVYIEPDTYLEPVEPVYGPKLAEKKKSIGYETYQDYEILYEDPSRASVSKSGLPVPSLMPLLNFGKNTSSLIVLSCAFVLALLARHIWTWMKLLWSYGRSTYAEERFKMEERFDLEGKATWLDWLTVYWRVLHVSGVVIIGYDIPTDRMRSD